MRLRLKILATVLLGVLPLVALIYWAEMPPAGEEARISRSTALLLGVAILLLSVGLGFELLVRRRLQHLLHDTEKLATAGPHISSDDEIGKLAARLAAAQENFSGKESQLLQETQQRKNAEAKVREIEERYVLAVRSSNDGLWEWNLKNDKAYFSPRWKAMLGYDEAEIGDHIDEWRKRIHPENRAAALKLLQAHLNGEAAHYQSEHRLKHRDGSYRWVMARGAAIHTAGGKPYRMVGLHTDVSERKRAEAVLIGIAESLAVPQGDAFFRTLVRNFVAVLNVHRAFIAECADQPVTQARTLAYWVGDGFEENIQFDLSGTPCEEVMKNGKVCFYPRNVPAIFPKDAHLGEESYLGIPIFASNGRVIGHMALWDQKPMPDDILIEPVFKIFAVRAGAEIERIWTELELVGEKDLNRELLHTLEEAVITTDAKGGIVYINPMVERLSGWEDKEIHGQPVDSLFRLLDQKTGESVHSALARCAGVGGHVKAANHAVLIRRDGEKVHVQRWAASFYHRRGEMAGAVLLFDRRNRDATKRQSAS